MSDITLVSGGRKSGKSDFAEHLASKYKNVTYVALSELRTEDEHWQKKINDHKSKRPSHWKLIETQNLINVLSANREVLLIDSIGGFVSLSLQLEDNDWNKHLNFLIYSLLNYKNKIIIVAEQVGLGLVSEYKIGNLFADRLGGLLKEITIISNENWLTINGKAIRLDNLFYEI
tara:strand:+ start:3128 stop:3649 length:522 start_codon:yes stop_codon:yes gene_type:complete